MNTRSIDQLLAQMRTAAALAGNRPAASAAGASRGEGFAEALKGALVRTNESQQQARALARSFEMGAPDVQLHDVMISLQKANIAFQQTVQVRNRLVAAYQEIMNMQV
jgi:flagellar hook-basal body complex protein FliE